MVFFAELTENAMILAMKKAEPVLGLEHARHSLAHLLAAAVLELWPDTKNTIGPAIDNGFYYDFEFSKPISESDLSTIEKKMREIGKHWNEFEATEVTPADAKKRFQNNPYKCELINEIADRKEKLTLYTSGTFVDLCRGGHVEDMKSIPRDSWKLSRIAGAYWRGDENKTMLTRIYGLAFSSKEELVNYEKQLEEAKKRDHRKLGKELDLFTISDLVGGGLPLFTPKGSVLRETLASYSQELQSKYGFERVWTPHMARTELYKYSGHFDKYPERFEVTSAESDDTFMLKPMNCPHHAQLFARKPWSYRELPVRYMENTTNYRDEKHGELHGLSRVRSLSQDDGHIFCQEEHMKTELRNIVAMVKELYGGLKLDYVARLSFRDESDKFLGNAETWKRAESVISEVAEEEGLSTISGPGEAAFYGPKIDFIVKDSLGREWQCATVQLDFVQPERFGLSYTDSDGKSKQPVMIHKALLGSIERFLSIYIEHTAGVFPLWLSPVQVKIIPIGEAHNAFAKDIHDALRAEDIRAAIDMSDLGFGKKVREAKNQKIPYFMIIGDKELDAKSVTLESRDKGNLGLKMITEVTEHLLNEIKQKISA